MNSNSETTNENTQRVSRKRARTRAALLAAARRVFATRGYHDASIAEITEQADIGVGTFYLHFRDKDELFTTLIQEGIQDIRDHVTSEALQQPFEQMLPAIVRLTFHYAYTQRDLFRIALTDGGQFGHKFQAKTALIEGLTHLFEIAQEQGMLEEYNSDLLARFIAGMILQGIATWFDNDEPGPDTMADQVLHLLRYGLPAQLLIEDK